MLDNGSEFAGRHFDAWAYQRGIRLDFIRPGRPIENAFIESFNGRVRDECLNVHWWTHLDEAQQALWLTTPMTSPRRVELRVSDERPLPPPYLGADTQHTS